MSVSNQSRKKVPKEAGTGSVTRMFDLADIFELVNDRLDDGSFPEQ